jgi:hypothetical protein
VFVYKAYSEGRIDEGICISRHGLVQVMNCERVVTPLYRRGFIPDRIRLYQLYGPVSFSYQLKSPDSQLLIVPNPAVPEL